MKTIDVTVSRLISGPLDAVFDAWLDPKKPGGPWSIAKKAIVQAVPDGLFYFGIERSPQLNPHYGRFVTVERPRLLVHTWMSENTGGIETMVEVTFEKMPGGTQMTIAHRGIPDTEGGRSHEKGWTYFVELIAKQFA